MNEYDERTRFVGLCEAEACWGDEQPPIVTPGRIGRRRATRWRATPLHLVPWGGWCGGWHRWLHAARRRRIAELWEQ